MSSPMKRCSRCHQDLDVSRFQKWKRICKDCINNEAKAKRRSLHVPEGSEASLPAESVVDAPPQSSIIPIQEDNPRSSEMSSQTVKLEQASNQVEDLVNQMREMRAVVYELFQARQTQQAEIKDLKKAVNALTQENTQLKSTGGQAGLTLSDGNQVSLEDIEALIREKIRKNPSIINFTRDNNNHIIDIPKLKEGVEDIKKDVKYVMEKLPIAVSAASDVSSVRVILEEHESRIIDLECKLERKQPASRKNKNLYTE